MEKEILLTGGRTTLGVVRIDNHVHRPVCENSGFVHEILSFAEQKGICTVPRYFGIDSKNREILSYLEGEVPKDLGWYSTEQCCKAAEIVKDLHTAFREFPGCPEGMTVCHNDLSPCNFVFSAGEPTAVIDWDSAAFGEPLDDLAYAVWLWLDIGNPENDCTLLKSRITAMLDAYGAEERSGFVSRMIKQMERTGFSEFPTEEYGIAVRQWAANCKSWTQTYLMDFLV